MGTELKQPPASLDYGELLKAAARSSVAGSNLIVLLGGALISGVVSILVVTAPAMLLGYTSVALKVARGEMVRWEDLFVGFQRFGAALALGVLSGVVIALGLVALVIPGVIAMFLFSFAPHLMAGDPSLSAVDSLKESVQMVKAHLPDMIVIWVIMAVIVATLSLVPVVGSLVGGGFAAVVLALAFLRISGDRTPTK